MTWIVSINTVIAQFELHNKKHSELVLPAVGYIAFLPRQISSCLKRKNERGHYLPLCAIAGRHYFRYVGNVLVPRHQYSWAKSFTKCSCCCWSLLLFFPLTDEYVFFSAYVYLPMRCAESETRLLISPSPARFAARSFSPPGSPVIR